jgi:predicted nucleic acid-binding protein
MRKESSLSAKMTEVRIVVDTYAWIELFIGSVKGEKVKEVLVNADIIYTPDTVLAEIARKYLREGMGESVIIERLKLIVKCSQVVNVNFEIAMESAKAYLELKEKAKQQKLRDPGLFDAIVLAVTRVCSAKVLTGDEHFKGLKETIWIGQNR